MTIGSGPTARVLALVGLALVLCVGNLEQAAAETPTSLRFALISPQTRQQMEANWTPVINALGRYLGMAVEADVSADYAGAIWSLRSGRAQLAWLGNKSAIEAVDNAGVEVFAQETYPSGLGGYYTYLIVHKDSALTSADDVIAQASGLTLGQGDVNSTSGAVVPSYYLFSRRHIEPRKIFKRVIRGNHEDNIRAVAEGRADVGTVASLVYDQVGRRTPEIVSATRIVWRSPLIPADPLVWRKDLPAELKARIAEFFLSYGAATPGKKASILAEERAVLDRLDIRSFVVSDNRQLASVRLLELAKARIQIEADESASAVDRARRLQEVDRKIGEIDRFSNSTAN